MSHLASLLSMTVHAGYVLECSYRCRPADYTPIRTYILILSDSYQEFSIDALHSVCVPRKDVEDQFPLLRFPPSAFWRRLIDRLDIFLNVPLLSTLAMQGDTAGN